MSPAPAAQFDFLEQFIVELLAQSGFGQLTEAQRLAYVPQLVAQAQERLGVELLPRLTDEQLEEFAAMVEKDGVTPEEWKTFWTGAVPNFDEEVKKVLQTFAADVRRIAASQSPAA